MIGVENLAAFFLASMLVIVLPGPATFYIVSKAHQSARLAGAAVAGIVCGDILLITLSGMGFATLVSQWPVLLSLIKIMGATYIAYLGISLWFSEPASREGVLPPE